MRRPCPYKHIDVRALRRDLFTKREKAITYLRSRGKYVLAAGAPQPSWGKRDPSL